MPLPGGPADKAGNRYEPMWTVVCMARVLNGEYESIRLEPPGPEGQGIEFYLRRGDNREYHQVKLQGSRHGHWTTCDLQGEGVLDAFRRHLADESSECVFVSTQDARDLRELADRARDAADLAEFKREFVKGKWGSELARLLKHWPGCSEAEAYSYLKRIQVRTIDEKTLRHYAEVQLIPHVDRDVRGASDVLFKYALEAVHQELNAARIADRLRSRGIRRPIWSEPRALSEVVQRANGRYTTRLPGELIRGELIQRDECAQVLAALQDGSAKRGAIIAGAAGSGKSTVLLQVIERLQQQSVPLLAFRIDLLEPTQQPVDIGRQIGLPQSPVATLAALAKGGPCVLILDQLDAVSKISGRNPAFFDCFDEIVRQALTQPAMRVVVACRRFDFLHDYRLRRLGGGDELLQHVDVGPLSDAAVRRIMKALGIEPSQLTEKQTKLLAMPAHLKLLCDVAQRQA